MKETIKLKITQSEEIEGISPKKQEKLSNAANKVIKVLKDEGYKVDAERADHIKNKKGKQGKVVRIIRQINLTK